MKNPLMRASNLALYLGFCALAGTGLMLEFRLPPGSRGGHGLTVLGMSRHDWGAIHLWIAWGVLAITVAHLALNWAWLRKIAGYRRWVPLLGGLALGGLALTMPLFLPVSRSAGTPAHDSQEQPALGHASTETHHQKQP